MTKVEEYDMTITSPRSPAGSTAGRNSIRWTAVQAGLWVGKVNGEFAGMIEATWGESENRRRAKFYALTSSGRARLAEETAQWERLSSAIALVVRQA